MGLLRVTLGAQTFGTSGNHKVVSQDKRLRGEVSTHLIRRKSNLIAQVRVVGQEGAHEEVEHAVRSAGGNHLLPSFHSKTVIRHIACTVMFFTYLGHFEDTAKFPLADLSKICWT